MNHYLSGQDIALTIPFTANGEPFIPDAASVTWTLRDSAGAVVVAHQDVPWNVLGTTKMTITVPGSANATTSRFEKRTVIVSATRSAGTPWSVRVPYGLTPWLNMTVSPADVRSFMGLGPSELSDADIDLVAAYIDVEDLLTESVFSAALVAGGREERVANEAVLGQSVLLLLPSLRQRVLMSKADGPLRAVRDKLDFTALAEAARGKLGAATTLLGSGTPDFTDALITLTEPTDPITGA